MALASVSLHSFTLLHLFFGASGHTGQHSAGNTEIKHKEICKASDPDHIVWEAFLLLMFSSLFNKND